MLNKDVISSTFKQITAFVRENPLVSGAAVAVPVLGGLSISQVAKRRRTRKKKKTKKKTKKRTKRTKRRKPTKKRRRVRRTPRTAGKGKDRSTRRIRYTKKGQPYVITRSGKAKFIKKSSAKRSHKRPGGRY